MDRRHEMAAAAFCVAVCKPPLSAAALLLPPPLLHLGRVRLFCPLHERLQLPRLRQRRQQLEGKRAAEMERGDATHRPNEVVGNWLAGQQGRNVQTKQLQHAAPASAHVVCTTPYVFVCPLSPPLLLHCKRRMEPAGAEREAQRSWRKRQAHNLCTSR